MPTKPNPAVVFPKDAKMQALYERVCAELGAPAELTARSGISYFSDLCESIIGQQLSGKAADTIIARIKELLIGHEFTPQSVIAADTEKLRGAGSSYAKIKYIKNLAEAWNKNEIEHSKFGELSDEEIITELTKVKGIGRWTAEMFLMFSLGRPDVFSAGDQGLRNALVRHYKINRKATPKQLSAKAQKWSPHRTLASRVLWRSLNLA